MATVSAPQSRVRSTAPSRRVPPATGDRPESRVKVGLYVLAAVLSLVVFVVPLLWALLRSLQPAATITTAPKLSTVFQLTLDNFRHLSGIATIPQAIANSILVSVGTAILTTVLATAAGYGFGRFR